MTIIDLHIDGFGKFSNFTASFHQGLNVIYGKNEAGKSTLHTFIRSVLFGLNPMNGIPDSNDLYTRFKPWDQQIEFKGSLRLEYNYNLYLIERTFSKGKENFTVFNETLNQQIDDVSAFMTEVLCGLTKVSYDNTISIGQLKSATESGMVTELKQYISNLNSTGNIALNATKAISYLEQQRRNFEFEIVPEAAKNFTSSLSEIRNIEKKIAHPEYENLLSSYQRQKTENSGLIQEKKEQKNKLANEIEKNKLILEQNQFTDNKSITTYGHQVQQLYDDYMSLKQQSEKGSRSVMSVIFIILGVGLLLAAGGWFLLNPSSNLSVLFPNLVLGGGGLLCFIISAMLRWWKASLSKEVTLTAQVLQEIYSRYLGETSISEETMAAMVGKIEEFHKISESIIKAERAIRNLSDDIANLEHAQDSCEKALNVQASTQKDLEQKLSRLSVLKQQVETLKNVLAENERIGTEIAAIDLSLETLKYLSETIRDSFGLHLNKTASTLISSITNGAYRSMNVDQELNVFLNNSSRMVPMSQVSSGTLDQIYLALRIASAKLIQENSDLLPLILDDSFALYDDDRLKSALRWLTGIYQGQIILFSCHRREIDFLSDEQITFHEIVL